MQRTHFIPHYTLYNCVFDKLSLSELNLFVLEMDKQKYVCVCAFL